MDRQASPLRVIESADKVIKWMKAAARGGGDVISFPEACLWGYPNSTDYRKRAKPKTFERAEMRVIRSAKRLGIAVVLGSVHWDNGALRNSLLTMTRF